MWSQVIHSSLLTHAHTHTHTHTQRQKHAYVYTETHRDTHRDTHMQPLTTERLRHTLLQKKRECWKECNLPAFEAACLLFKARYIRSESADSTHTHTHAHTLMNHRAAAWLDGNLVSFRCMSSCVMISIPTVLFERGKKKKVNSSL